MNDKRMEPLENNGEEYLDADKKNRKGSILSFVVCTLLAIIVWLVIMNYNDLSNAPMPIDLAVSAPICEVL